MKNIDSFNKDERIRISKVEKIKGSIKHILYSSLMALGVYYGSEYNTNSQDVGFIDTYFIDSYFRDTLINVEYLFGNFSIDFSNIENVLNSDLSRDDNLLGLYVNSLSSNKKLYSYGDIDEEHISMPYNKRHTNLGGNNYLIGYSSVYGQNNNIFIYFKLYIDNKYEVFVKYLLDYEKYFGIANAILPNGYNFIVKNNLGDILYRNNNSIEGTLIKEIDTLLFKVELRSFLNYKNYYLGILTFFLYWSCFVFFKILDKNWTNISSSNDNRNINVKNLLDETLKNTKMSVLLINGTGCVENVNNSFLLSVGEERQNIVGKSIFTIVSPEDKSKLKLRNTIQFIRFKTQNGKEIFTITSITCNEYIDGNKVYLFSIDISSILDKIDHLNAEKELLLEKFNLLENIFAKEVHDLRSPLHSILVASELLTTEGISDENKDYIEVISKAGEVMSNLINNILDNTKLNQTEVKLNNEEINIVDIVEEVYFIMKPFAISNNINFAIKINSVNIPVYIGDKLKIQKIILNIVSNSLKYTGNGGNVIISLLVNEYDEIVFKIKDNGTGMSKSQLAVLFDDYSQFRFDVIGTGLGMSITKKLVDLMGGNITVKSTEGVGSTFTIKLPLKKTDKTISNESLIDVTTSLKTNNIDLECWIDKKILVVDDNHLNRYIAKNILKNFSNNTYVEVVSSGIEALEILKKEDFDLILLDIHMPDMNGYQFAEIVKNELNLDIGIIALTGDIIDPKYKDYFHNVIMKPYKADNLINLINNYFLLKKMIIELSDDIHTDNNQEKNSVDNNYIEDSISSIIDLKQFESIITLVGFDGFKHEIIKSLTHSIDKLSEYMEYENSDKFFEETHSLKGSAGNVGAIAIFNTCLKIEENKDNMLEINRLFNVLLKDLKTFIGVLGILKY